MQLQYIGARYVPLFYENSNDGSTQWEPNVVYDPLIWVTLTNGHMYISKKQVPATIGSPADNIDYWLDIGNYNGFIEIVQGEIDEVSAKIGDLSTLIAGNSDNVVDAINSITLFVTPKMFGAKGDGVTDDTTALQNCIDYAFEYRLPMIVTSGDYLFTTLTIMCATHGGDNFVPDIFGVDRNTCHLKHTGIGVAINVVYDTDANHADGLRLHDLFIEGNNDTTILLELCKGTNFTLYNLRLTKASVAGISEEANIWVSSFEYIRIVDCATGIKVRGESVTSITYNEIYVLNATVYAYDLTGRYNNIGVLAADSCSGECVYNFYWFSGTCGSLACELPDVTTALAKFNNSIISMNEFRTWRPTFESGAVAPIWASQSEISIFEVNLSDANSTTLSMPIASMYASVVSIFSDERSNISCETGADRGSNTSLFIYKNIKMIPYAKRAFIGSGSVLPNSIQKKDFATGATIYTDCAGSPRYGADGRDLQYMTPAKKGDWFMENKPDTNYAAAYVMFEDSTGDITSKQYQFIPVVKAGDTAHRPANAPVGSYYYDLTLLKPIWKSSTGWRDATNALV